MPTSLLGDEDGPSGPSVDSDIQAERIQARRERIAARQLAENGEETEQTATKGAPSVLDDEAHKSMAQIVSSRQYLDAVVEQGSDKVSLVRTTADMTESQRASKLDSSRIERRQMLKEDVAASEKEVALIDSKWDAAISEVGTEDLRLALEGQQKMCQALLGQKQELIEKFRVTLKNKDEEFVKELRAQASDVQTMLDVMGEQAKATGKEYKSQFEAIEDTFREERADLVTTALGTWEKQMKLRSTTEVAQHAARAQQVSDGQAQLDHLRMKDSEHYNQVKLKLETDIQNLEQELQRMRATYQLNAEKLEYNLQVLRKRDDENQTTKIQQKRKMLRLQDTLNVYKGRIKKQEKQYQDENAVLTEDYKRITDQFKDLQKKFKHFQHIERERYDEVWQMAEEEAVEAARKVLAADQCIFEQQLGLAWHGPDEAMLSSAPKLADDGEDRAAQEALVEIMADEDTESLSGGAVRAALELLCDEAGFLVESKLDRLLEPLAQGERSLMKLDSIFKALGVETEADIHRLASYFIRPDPSRVTTAATDAGGGDAGPAEEMPELISPDEVAAALRQFVDDFRRLKGFDQQPDDPDLDGDRRDRRFWDRLIQTHPTEHFDLWGVLGDALKQYGEILKDRAVALDDCDSLQAQNQELKYLLHQYMSADINKELVIPPTVVMAHQVRSNAQ
eukprot:gene8484-27538_t